jgi:hypothetical protein
LAESLSRILELFREVKQERTVLRLEWPVEDWLRFPDDFRQRFLGVDRFSPEDLRRWQTEHPKGAGPMMYGPGDPSRR